MQNMMILDDNRIQTPYGIFGGVTAYDVYESGEIKSVILNDKNMLLTHAGEIVPAYNETPRRKYKPSVEFYRNGMVKSVALDEQQELETPIGNIPVELITFYETGEIKRVFPLDGKISGFWSEEDEKKLNIPFNFDLGFTVFNAMLNGICFYKDGDIKSITLYPGEQIVISTNYGNIDVRNGFSLYEDGSLQSCEPSINTVLNTPIGKISAYDNNANGINADSNSLAFDKSGNITSLITVSSKIAVQTDEGVFKVYKPDIIPPASTDEEETVKGLRVKFNGNELSFDDEKKIYYIDKCGFTIMPFSNAIPTCSPSDCANCSLCNK